MPGENKEQSMDLEKHGPDKEHITKLEEIKARRTERKSFHLRGQEQDADRQEREQQKERTEQEARVNRVKKDFIKALKDPMYDINYSDSADIERTFDNAKNRYEADLESLIIAMENQLELLQKHREERIKVPSISQDAVNMYKDKDRIKNIEEKYSGEEYNDIRETKIKDEVREEREIVKYWEMDFDKLKQKIHKTENDGQDHSDDYQLELMKKVLSAREKDGFK